MTYDPWDTRYDTPTPTPDLIREFVAGLGPAIAEARAADAAIKALRAHGARYMTEVEARLIERYGSRADRDAVAATPRLGGAR